MTRTGQFGSHGMRQERMVELPSAGDSSVSGASRFSWVAEDAVFMA